MCKQFDDIFLLFNIVKIGSKLHSTVTYCGLTVNCFGFVWSVNVKI